MLAVFIRVVVLYLFSVLAMRLMGKRQVGQLQPYELVLALMVAEIAASPMENMGTPLLYGLVPTLGLMVLHGVCTALSVKWLPVRRLLNGRPGVVIRQGCMDTVQMQKMGYTVEDLMEELRGLGYPDISEIETAILETNGRLSAFPKTVFEGVQKQDVLQNTPEKGMPRLLVVDGQVQKEHLMETGHDDAWLKRQLEKAGEKRTCDVVLASLNGEGRMYVQGKRKDRPCIFSAEGEG